MAEEADRSMTAPESVTAESVAQKYALKHYGFDSVEDLHYWSTEELDLARFDALSAIIKEAIEEAQARQSAEAASREREARLVEALGNAKWVLEGIKRAGWVTNPSYGDEMNLALDRIAAALAQRSQAERGE